MSESVNEVAPGIFQMRIPMPENPLGYTLPYLVTGPDKPILIDTGLRSEEGIEALEDQLRGQLGIKPGQIDFILITHNHPDHYGLAIDAKKLTGGRTAMHRIDWEQSPFREAMEAIKRDPKAARTGGEDRMKAWYRRHGVPEEELQGQLFGGRRGRRAIQEEERRQEHPEGIPSHGDSAERGAGEEREARQWALFREFEPPDLLLDGSEVYKTGKHNLRAFWTPGHTPGHLCWVDEEARLVFTGDHILPIITSNVSVRMTSDGDPLGDYLDSVAKVGELDVDLVLPAHEHHFTDLKGRVAELHKHHDARLDAVLKAADGPPRTAYEVAAGVPWDVGGWDEMDEFLRRAAVGETLSHLEHLSRKGTTRRIRDEGSPLVRWQAVQ